MVQALQCFIRKLLWWPSGGRIRQTWRWAQSDHFGNELLLTTAKLSRRVLQRSLKLGLLSLDRVSQPSRWKSMVSDPPWKRTWCGATLPTGDRGRFFPCQRLQRRTNITNRMAKIEWSGRFWCAERVSFM